ncbi:MAG TPA: hypothetical protein VI432_01185 [Candidatus Paceibacterota bacterium]
MKNDKYRKARAGHSKILQLTCAKCEKDLFRYQKDGLGILKRLYLDRIIDNRNYSKNLVCPKCRSVLGIKIIYKKENRPAYRLFAGTVFKTIVKK